MFRGRFLHTIDTKGRVAVPLKFRDVLREKYDERLVVTNFDACVVAYPFSEWRALEERLLAQSKVQKDVRAFLRFFISGASEVALDRQGRILVPPTLRAFAVLEKEVMVSGMLTFFEIWDRGKWEQEIQTYASSEYLDQIREALANRGV